MTKEEIETRDVVFIDGDTRTEITIAPYEGDFRTRISIIEGFERMCELVLIACRLRRLVTDHIRIEGQWPAMAYDTAHWDVPNCKGEMSSFSLHRLRNGVHELVGAAVLSQCDLLYP